MVAWTGLEHFRPVLPPPAIEPDDFVVRSLNKEQYFKWPRGEEYAQGRSEARSLRTARVHPSLTSNHPS
ncbi:unnamed protein product [Brassica oleracea]